MTGLKLSADEWANALRGLIAYRGASSPEKLAAKFDDRLSGKDIRRLVKSEDPLLGTPRGDIKLYNLAGMLDLPPTSLELLYYGDRKGIERLSFEDVPRGAEIKQYLLDLLQPPRGRSRSAG